MKWYYEKTLSHTHVKVYVNGAFCGRLCFRNEEFEEIWDKNFEKKSTIKFIGSKAPDELPEPEIFEVIRG